MPSSSTPERGGADRRARRGRAPVLALGSGSVVVVTGGGSGIGRLVALGAARKGAHVVLWDRDEAAALRVAVEAEAVGGRGTAIGVDLADADAIAEAARRTLELGGVDVLVNNAGVVSGRPLAELEVAQIERTMRVNAIAPILVTRALLPAMESRGAGRVVTVASAAGFIGVAGQTDYAASKFAAVGFMESLRAELRRSGSPVTALTVAPYYIDTGMFDGVTTKVPALLPILSAAAVATRILAAIESRRALLALPPLVRAVPALRALPVAVVDRLADALGLQEGMAGFRGRASAAPAPLDGAVR
ncbi:SDR family NAD(P)-dependent oxidoreductase [Agrococcus sp. SL85]|uniref:SDR family NAD(P)-dependent oxidoreductase n=1 Tax=Agrococcus sp. SL85 TaxID=2995141 RepID=UPI00226C9A5A|nr:SDR family NAD(P)-dependent oxidoreductase [Agrococcus sp. SL85]WAC67361.1 SDR family NAD(P)-dependent oxidoreductase [Agrococcus sp. SL85]